MSTKNAPVKVPVILQMEALECGAASLAMILAYYKKWVPLEQVRVACGISRDGSNALNIVKAANAYGLEHHAYWHDVKSLQEKAHTPAILFWNQNHFVVLNGFRRGYADLNDPASGHVRISIEEFARHYSGLCIELKPGEGFVTGGKPKGILDHLKGIVRENKSLVGLVMITGALAMAAGSLVPVITRAFTDEVMTGVDTSWYQDLIDFFIRMIFFQFIASALNEQCIRYSTGKVSALSSTSLMEHLLHMPMEFFSQRMAGDLAAREESNDDIAQTLIGKLSPILINFIMLVFYLFVMIQYSPLLTAGGLVTVILNIVIANFISRKRTEISRVQMRDYALLGGATVAGIDMVETIKASGTENGFLRQWSGFHAGVIRSRVTFDSVNRVYGAIPEFLQSVTNIVILLLGVWSIMEGYFTEGLLLAFQSCISAFLLPVNRLIDAGQSLQEMKSSMERIEDVMKYPEEVSTKEAYSFAELEDAEKLSGVIEMRHVTFGYSRLGEPLLKDFSFTITPGKRIAIVGGSGSGKSTIAKLLCGLYRPWEGEILFDGVPISEIPTPIFRGSVAMVNQEVTLFRDTVANNIRMWDQTIEDYDVILAARDAQIHDDIMSYRNGYQMMLEDNGKNLSGGQRQRLEIARVLAQDPSIIIMDEATSALDAITERDVSDNIHGRGITSIIIAHRLSAIRDCDEILVLDHGKLLQRGTHEELIAQEGLYRDLVASQ